MFLISCMLHCYVTFYLLTCTLIVTGPLNTAPWKSAPVLSMTELLVVVTTSILAVVTSDAVVTATASVGCLFSILRCVSHVLGPGFTFSYGTRDIVSSVALNTVADAVDVFFLPYCPKIFDMFACRVLLGPCAYEFSDVTFLWPVMHIMSCDSTPALLSMVAVLALRQ